MATKNNNEGDNLYEFIQQYRDKFHNAQDPLDYISAFGSSGMKDIIKEANGREIVFSYGSEEGSGLKYTFK